MRRVVNIGAALGMLLGGACMQAPPSASEAARAAATAAPGLASGAVSAAQTAAPQLQATATALGPTVQAAVGAAVDAVRSDEFQNALRQAGNALSGLKFDVTESPPNAAPEDATRVTIAATDPTGTFVQLDQAAKQAAVQAALLAAGERYPRATIDLTVNDSSGKQIITATKPPAGQPVVTVLQ